MIVLARLYNGEMIMGEESSDTKLATDEFVDLRNPRIVMFLHTMGGGGQVAITSVCAPFNVKRLKDSLRLSRHQVMFWLSEDEIDKELVAGYKSEVSGIKVASAADVAALNATKGPGDIIL